MTSVALLFVSYEDGSWCFRRACECWYWKLQFALRLPRIYMHRRWS